ncbi:BrnA antitoxin family protein, partial [Acinetobacter baumannii]
QGDKVIRRGRPRSDNSKQAVSLRVDADVLEWFKSSGAGWQTRINEALRTLAGLGPGHFASHQPQLRQFAGQFRRHR